MSSKPSSNMTNSNCLPLTLQEIVDLLYCATSSGVQVASRGSAGQSVPARVGTKQVSPDPVCQNLKAL